METKICNHCHRELPVSMFHKRTAAPDGLQSRCKACQNEMTRKSKNAQ